jgi:hypothetical protein
VPFKSCDQQKAICAKDKDLCRKWISKYGSACGDSDTEMKAKNDHLKSKRRKK